MCEWTATNLSTLKVWINFQRIFSNFAESDLLIVSMNCMAYFWAIIFCQYCTRIVNRLEASDWNCSFSNEKWNFCIEIKKTSVTADWSVEWELEAVRSRASVIDAAPLSRFSVAPKRAITIKSIAIAMERLDSPKDSISLKKMRWMKKYFLLFFIVIS